MFQDLATFSKEIHKGIPPLSLVISKEEKEAIDLVFKNWQGQVRYFEGENFSILDFTSHVENLFLFDEPILCYIRDVDKLQDIGRKVLISYLARPNKNISLLLSSTNPTLIKEVKQCGGLVLQPVEEKPWQKKQRMERLLADEAIKLGFIFQIDAIRYLIDCVGNEKDILLQEFEKLVTFAFPKKTISIDDIKVIVHQDSFSTLWDLGEAIFAKNFSLSLERGKSMLEDGVSLFALIAQLRGQYRTLLSMSTLYEEGGVQLLIQEFPYLKGNILAKKIEEMKRNSIKSLKKGLFFLFEAELKAKSVNLDSLFIFELLLINLLAI